MHPNSTTKHPAKILVQFEPDVCGYLRSFDCVRLSVVSMVRMMRGNMYFDGMTQRCFPEI